MISPPQVVSVGVWIITLKVKRKAHKRPIGALEWAAADLSKGRMIAPGGVIVRFLSRFGTLEEGFANDRQRRCDCSQD
jgi:hypothetical protein